MPRRGRWSLRWVKWACLAATVAVWSLCWISNTRRVEGRFGARYVGLTHFSITYGRYSSPAVQNEFQGWRIVPQTGKYGGNGNLSGPGWWFHSIELTGPAVLLALLTTGLFISSLANRFSIPPGHCRRCRYDLSGSPGGPCPECGVFNGSPAHTQLQEPEEAAPK